MPLYNSGGNPVNDPRLNADLNSIGSNYATIPTPNHATNLDIEKVTSRLIFDASPQQFFDLKLINMKEAKFAASDEFFFKRADYQRIALEVEGAGGAGAAAVAGTTVSDTIELTPDSMNGVSVNTVITYPDNSQAVVTAVDTVANTIDVNSLTGEALPVAADGEFLQNHSGIEADKVDEFARYCKLDTVEDFNFIQLFSKAICYGDVEMHKLKHAGASDNFLEMEKRNMFNQMRIDVSNAFWNGTRGEFALANGRVAKTTGGVFPTMVDAGSPNTTATAGTDLKAAFEDIVTQTEFREFGATRFAFASSAVITALSREYKDDLANTRYAPTDEVAQLQLRMINLGSSKIVLVPFQRFNDSASFPADFATRLFILDLENISMRQMWGTRSGMTPDNRANGYRKNLHEIWVEMNMGVEFQNPLSSGYIDVTIP